METEMSETHNIATDKLVADLKAVVADAEELLRSTAGQAGERAAAAREKINDGLDDAKRQLYKVEGLVVDKSHEAAKVTDRRRVVVALGGHQPGGPGPDDVNCPG